MLPTTTPFSACWPMAMLLHDLELAVLHLLHARLVLRVARRSEGELAQRRVQGMDLAQPGLDVLAAGLAAGREDRFGQDVYAGVRLRRELIGAWRAVLHRVEEALGGGRPGRPGPRGGGQ